jgi:hypothetical protein
MGHGHPGAGRYLGRSRVTFVRVRSGLSVERLEAEIAEWRAFVEQGATVDGPDIDELEDHLRDQVGDLTAAGLADDEAFLIAVKRMGKLDELSREFAREHSGRLWRQFVLPSGDEGRGAESRWPEVLAFAVAAAVAVQVARVASGFPGEESSWLVRNAGLLVLPFLAGYFARRRRLSSRQWLVTASPFVVAALVINLYPWGRRIGHGAPRRGTSAHRLVVRRRLPISGGCVALTRRSHGLRAFHR